MSTARPIRFDSAPRGCFFKPAPRYGFTLLELLVVIGIIAVLIGILMPALAAARRSAQTIKCQANLRTLGQAMMMHSNEHRGFFPLSGLIYNGATNTASPKGLGDGTMQRYDYFNNSTTTPTTLVLDALPCALSVYLGLPSSSMPGQGYKWEDAYANTLPLRAYFTCPANEELIAAKWEPEDAVMAADNGDPTVHNPYGNGARWWNCTFGGNYTNGYSSYGFNDEILGWNDNGYNSVTGYSRARGNVAIIPNPSDTMLMADGNVNTWVAEPGGSG